ncbi:MAG: bestrophin family protein [Proteobacteria bacterium]|nr:bestrophin family protein [Pseudomonadota bacterium]
MVIREAPKPWELLFILRGSIIPAIWPQLLAVIAIASFITWAEMRGILYWQAISPLAFSLIGIALSIFSGFRNSASYERWWEARKVLGQHIVEMRSLSRQVAAYCGLRKGARLLRLMLVFVEAFRSHLRGEAMGPDGLRQAERANYKLPATSSNLPDRLLTEMGVELARLARETKLAPQLLQVMEERLIAMSSVLAAAERIKLTPLPFAYSLLLHRTAYLFCLLLPFGLIDTAGLWTPVLAGIVAYTFFGLDALGDQLAAPFGTEDNCMPLSAISRTIEIGILETLGETEIPPQREPKGYVLD